MKIPRYVPRLYLQWFGGDQGLVLELCEGDTEGRLASDGLYPAATIVADATERLWLEIYPAGGAVRLPLAEVEAAILQAKGSVRYQSSASDQRQEPPLPGGKL